MLFTFLLFLLFPLLALIVGLTVFLVYHFNKKKHTSSAPPVYPAPPAAAPQPISPPTPADGAGPATRRPLGQVIKEHRTRCGMTQEFVADRLGVSRQAVSKWEAGSSDPSTGNLLALARLFDISAEEMLSDVE